MPLHSLLVVALTAPAPQQSSAAPPPAPGIVSRDLSQRWTIPGTVLDLARDSAHEVERLAAPLTAFLVGVAVGRGDSLGGAAAKVTALALTSAASSDPPTGSESA